jgi:hypothetical protein
MKTTLKAFLVVALLPSSAFSQETITLLCSMTQHSVQNREGTDEGTDVGAQSLIVDFDRGSVKVFSREVRITKVSDDEIEFAAGTSADWYIAGTINRITGLGAMNRHFDNHSFVYALKRSRTTKIF